MSDFAGIGAAPAPQRTSEYLSDGTYLTTIMALKKKTSENPRTRGDKMIIVEMAVAEVLVSKEYNSPVHQTPQTSSQVGEVVSCFLKFKWFSFMEKMKALLCAIMKLTPEEAANLSEQDWVELAEKAVENDGASVRGAVIKVKAKTIGVPVKDPQGEFTVIDFFLAEAEPAEAEGDDIPF